MTKNAGRYRDSPVYVLLESGKKRKFCDPLFIRDEMDNFFTWFFSEKQELSFIDGNDRMTRLLMI